MAEGEYASMHALYSVAPDMVPQPLGWGTLEADANSHFFLCEYVDLAEEVPDPISLCKKLADLHRKSIAMSPNGMFGFEVTTCNGTFPQDNRWNESWEAFFAQQMEGAFEAEQEVHGLSEDYQRLLPALYEKVIPRLLRPLETGENTLKPALTHGENIITEICIMLMVKSGDLWDGNVSFHVETDESDSLAHDVVTSMDVEGLTDLGPTSTTPAHFGDTMNVSSPSIAAEKRILTVRRIVDDLHNWRATRFKIRKTFVKEYFKNFPMSPPQEDWDDRNLLYSM
jgi:protein-ribulosamine 3-kinase